MSGKQVHSFPPPPLKEPKGIQATNVTRWDYFYFRTKNGTEIDLVLEGSFGLLPIEIKLGHQVTLRQLTALQQFIERNDLPFDLVINNSNEVRMLNEKIIQIPAGCF